MFIVGIGLVVWKVLLVKEVVVIVVISKVCLVCILFIYRVIDGISGIFSGVAVFCGEL